MPYGDDEVPPQHGQDAQNPGGPAGGTSTGHSKRRQYAPGQSQAYYGAQEPSYGGDAGGGYYAGGPQAGGQGYAGGGGTFVPGIPGEQPGFSQQQQQAQAGYTAPNTYGQPPPQGWYAQNPQHPSNPLQGPPGQDMHGAAAPNAGYGGMDSLNQQFGQMGMGGAKPVSSRDTYLFI